MDSKSVIIDIRPRLINVKEYVKNSYSMSSSEIYLAKYTKNEIKIYDLFAQSNEVKKEFDERHKVIILKSEDTNEMSINIITKYCEENNIPYEIFYFSEYIKTISKDLIISYLPIKQIFLAHSPQNVCFGRLSEIIPGLYLSGAERIHVNIKEYKIKNVLSVLKTYMPKLEEGCNHMKIEIHDTINQNIEQYFEEAHKFIDEALEKKERVLVHCYAGISRSATIVISYLMKKNLITFDKAYEMVKGKRKCISPNFSFIIALKEYEKTYLITV